MAYLAIVFMAVGALGAIYGFTKNRRRVRVEARRCVPRFDKSSDLIVWKATNVGWPRVVLKEIGVVAAGRPIPIAPDSRSSNDGTLPKPLERHDTCYVGQSLRVVFDELRNHGLEGEVAVQAYFEDVGGRRFYGRPTLKLDSAQRLVSTLGVSQNW